MVASVGAANGRGVHSSLSSHFKVIHTAESADASVKSTHRLEVQPQLAHVVTDLVDSVGACARTRGSVGAGIAGVSDVGRVCFDNTTTGRFIDNTYIKKYELKVHTSSPNDTHSIHRSQQRSFRLRCHPWLCTPSWCSRCRRWRWSWRRCTPG